MGVALNHFRVNVWFDRAEAVEMLIIPFTVRGVHVGTGVTAVQHQIWEHNNLSYLWLCLFWVSIPHVLCKDMLLPSSKEQINLVPLKTPFKK